MSLEGFAGRKSPSTSKKTRRAQFKDARTDFKQSAANARNATHRALSTEEKFAKLDVRLGVFQGAIKERAKLNALLAAELEAKRVVAEVKVEKSAKKTKESK